MMDTPEGKFEAMAIDDSYPEAMDIQAKEEERTRVFPSELPMQFPYARPRYYVRRCYSEYYDLILEMLAENDIVTVTGTPGIGKSIFYAYFYQRYKEIEENEENKENEENRRKTIIIAASFRKDSGIKQAVVFQEDGTTQPWEGGDVNTFICTAHKAALVRNAEVLYLFDGPPVLPPIYPLRMVCFTSPNERWLEEVRKNEQACELYMPLWTLEELLDAAKHLDLGAGVTQEKIEERFVIFGGVARGCLSAKETFVAKMIESLTEGITGMDSLYELERLVNKEKGGPQRHRMCHYQPKANRGSYDVQIASPFVSRLVLEKLTARNFRNRDTLLQLLQGIPKAAAFRGHLFEMKAHEQLVRGGVIETQCISKPDKPMEKFTLDKSKDFSFFDHKELSIAMHQDTENPYHIPRAANFESMDSFYCDIDYDISLPLKKMRKLLLFQMPMSSTHPVKGKGIVALLKAVGWLDRAVEDPASRVALIFVCPDGSDDVIGGKQQISWRPAADGESVTVIPGIDYEMAAYLDRINVRTLGDFRSKLPEPKQSQDNKIVRCVENFDTFKRDQTLAELMLPRIPQYVWRL